MGQSAAARTGFGPSAAARTGFGPSAASRTDLGSCRLRSCRVRKLPLGIKSFGKVPNILPLCSEVLW